MINLNSVNRIIYQRGLAYYKEGRVIKFESDKTKDSYEIHAVVEGTDDYDVSISIRGREAKCRCSCPAFAKDKGICKHIVAAILHINNNPEILERGMKKEQHIIEEDLIKELEKNGYIQERVPVNMELALERLGEIGKRGTIGLAMRVGDKRLYVVKSIKGFAQAIYTGSTMEFGKGFTYNPDKCFFTDEDKPIIDFLLDMYDIDLQYNFWRVGTGGIFQNNKYLCIPENSKKRFFDILGDKKFKLILNGREYENVQVIKGEIPVLYDVKANGDDIELGVSGGIMNSYPLDEELRYIFRNGKVFYVPEQQRRYLVPILTAAKKKEGNILSFPREYRQKFIEGILPALGKSGEVSMDEGLKNQIRKEPLKAKAYLDKDGDGVTMRLEYEYGEYSFNALKPENMEDIILIRDTEAEKRIANLLANCRFKQEGEQLSLDDEGDIYDFLQDGLDSLREICEVYCTESFKNMMIYNERNYRIGIEMNEAGNMLEFSFNLDGIKDIDISELAMSIREKKRYHRLKDGSYLAINSKRMDVIAHIVDASGLKKDELKGKTINMPAYRAMYVDNRLAESGVKVSSDEQYREMVGRIKKPENLHFAVPDSLAGILRPYQLTGFKWLKTLAAYGMGGILADDMGLGKTLEGLAFLLSEKQEKGLYGKPTIIICPTSLIYNWESEAKKFTPSLRVAVITGSRPQREKMVAEADGYDIIVTSYPLIRRDIELYRDMEFSYCILDEAQHIKNPMSDNARSVKDIKAKGRFAFTGTPIENNLTELWSIFDFLMPGYLFSHKKFVEKFEKPIIKNNAEDARQDLIRHIRPFILRRMKKDVLKELPEKIETCYKAELTKQQKMVYMNYLHRIKDEIGKEIDKSGFEKSRIKVLAGLTRLRQICCHPGMFLEGYGGGSGKIDLLMETIEDIKEGGHRALLFSQFTSALQIISGELDRRGITYFYLDGSVRSNDRFDMVKRFNDGEKDIFLISLKAGGTGLNLTGADTVIHFDPWWNPAAEDQATDRAHRIGQKKWYR